MKLKLTSLQAGGGICVSVAASDTKETLTAVHSVQQEVDVIEIRLDSMQEINIAALCEQIDNPLLFTNRPTWEGGFSREPEEERIAPLLEAVNHGAPFIDLELKTFSPFRKQLLEKTSGTKTRLIISHHDFEKTPDSASLSLTLTQQIQSGAHIGKIVTMAHDPLDVLRVLHLLCEAQNNNFPLIAFCMGEEGKLSRIITLLLGGFMTYAALDEQQATAPGQLSVHQLKEAMATLSGRNATG